MVQTNIRQTVYSVRTHYFAETDLIMSQQAACRRMKHRLRLGSWRAAAQAKDFEEKCYLWIVCWKHRIAPVFDKVSTCNKGVDCFANESSLKALDVIADGPTRCAWLSFQKKQRGSNSFCQASLSFFQLLGMSCLRIFRVLFNSRSLAVQQYTKINASLTHFFAINVAQIKKTCLLVFFHQS